MIKDIISQNENTNANDFTLRKLHADFPQCFDKDGKFNMEKFKKLVSDNVEVTRESYELNFLGKNYAHLIASTETETVIQPDVENNNKPENKDSKNVYISGDNIDALKHLLKSYSGKIKCIYIDPPYNTGSDGFVYNDKFGFTSEQLQVKLDIDEDRANRILDLCKRGSASHSAWLTYMSPRLMLAKDLLTDDGVIFISIDDNEQANLKILCDEIFGEENFVFQIAWRRTDNQLNIGNIARVKEYIICYSRTDKAIIGRLQLSDKAKNEYRYRDSKGLFRRSILLHKTRGRYFYSVTTKDGNILNGPWMISKEEFDKMDVNDEIYWTSGGDQQPYGKIYLSDTKGQISNDFWGIEYGTNQRASIELEELFNKRIFDFPKPISLVKLISSIGSNIDSIIIDFFSGSATTAHAVMQLNAEDGGNRKYIMVQIQEETPKSSEARKAGYNTIDEIGQERIRRAAAKIRKEHPDYNGDLGFKHYILKDVPQNTLDKMEHFDPNNTEMFADTDILRTFGKNTVLETWCVRDGYGLSAQVKELKLENYTAYYCGNHLYFIDGEGFDENAMAALIDEYNKEASFSPQNIIMFGYNFTFIQTEMVKRNISILDLMNKPVVLDIRY